jgi:hypothetical protein
MQSSGKLGGYGTSHLRIENTLKGGRGSYPRVESVVRTTSTYLIEGHGLEGLVTEDDYSNVQAPFDAELDETTGLTSILALGKEKSLADTLGSTAILTQNKTLVAAGQFSDSLNSDPLKEFAAARAAIKAGSGVVADMIAIVPWEVVNVLAYHPQLLDSLGYKFARPGGLTYDELKNVLKVKAIFVPEASYETAKDGQASSLAPVWGKNIIFAILPDTATKRQVSLGYLVKFANRAVRRVTKWAINNPANSTAILVDDHYDMLISNVGAGYLIKNAIA